MNIFQKLPKSPLFYLFAVPTSFFGAHSMTMMLKQSYYNRYPYKGPAIGYDGMALDKSAHDNDMQRRPRSIKDLILMSKE